MGESSEIPEKAELSATADNVWAQQNVADIVIKFSQKRSMHLLPHGSYSLTP